jgi:hypothetical protein
VPGYNSVEYNHKQENKEDGMTLSPVETEVLAWLQKLPQVQQYTVLAVVRALATPHGTPGHMLRSFAGSIPHAEVQQMAQAIEQDCEQVNLDEW